MSLAQLLTTYLTLNLLVAVAFISLKALSLAASHLGKAQVFF